MKQIASLIKSKYCLRLFSKSKNLQQINAEGRRNISELHKFIEHTSVKKVSQQNLWDDFLLKLTSLILMKKVREQVFSIEELKLLEKCFSQFRLSYIPQKGTPSQIINSQLLFKQLKQLISPFRFKVNENKMSMLSQNLPKFASYSGYQPFYVALLYYMGEISANIRSETKSQIFNFMIRYYVFLSDTRNKENNNKKQYAKDFFNWVDFTAIILSSTERRQIKNAESHLTASLIIKNLGKYFHQVKIRYLAKYLIEVFPMLFQKLAISEYSLKQSETNQIIGMLSRVPDLSAYYSTAKKPKLVLNTLKNTLFIADMFINIISKDFIHMKNDGLYEEPAKRSSQYIFSMFMAAQNMKVWVLVSQQKNHFPFNSASIIGQLKLEHQNLFQFKLWKLSSQIVQNLSIQRFHCTIKDQLLDLITYRLIQAIKSPERSVLTKDYEREISETLRFIPLKILTKHLYKAFSQNIYECLSNVEKDEKSIQVIIKLYKTKNVLIMPNQDWAKLFNQFIQKDDGIVFWKLYFFLASSQVQEFIKIIPFHRIIKLSSSCMKVLKGYQQRNKELDSQSLRTGFFILRLHAIYLLSGISQPQFQKLLAQNSKSQILTVVKLNKLFEEWINPQYKFIGKYSSDNKLIWEKEKGNMVDKFEAYKQSIHFSNYFEQIFLQTGCPNQYKLIQLILSNKETQIFLSSCSHSSIHTLGPYFILIFYGLANRECRSYYQKKYEHLMDKLLKQLQQTNTFYSYIFHLRLKEVSHRKQLQVIVKLMTFNSFYYTQIVTHLLEHLRVEEKCSVAQNSGQIGLKQIKEFVKDVGQVIISSIKISDRGKIYSLEKVAFYLNLVQQMSFRYSIPSDFLEVSIIDDLKKWIIDQFCIQFIKSEDLNWIILRIYFFGLLDSQFCMQLYRLSRGYSNKNQIFYVLSMGHIMGTNREAKEEVDHFNKTTCYLTLLKKNRYWIFPLIKTINAESLEKYIMMMRNLQDQFEINLMLKQLQVRLPQYKQEDIKAKIFAQRQQLEDEDTKPFNHTETTYIQQPFIQNEQLSKMDSQNALKKQKLDTIKKHYSHIVKPLFVKQRPVQQAANQENEESLTVGKTGIFQQRQDKKNNGIPKKLSSQNKKEPSKESIKSSKLRENTDKNPKNVGLFKKKTLI